MVKRYLNKKGSEQAFWIIIKLVVAVVALVVIASIFFPGIINQGDWLRGSLAEVKGDDDGDGYPDFQDKCPCTYGDLSGDGCPLTFTDEEKTADRVSYNSDTKCGNSTLSETVYSSTPLDSGGFEAYHSIELFEYGEGRSGDAEIRQACTSWVGEAGCESQDDDCNEKFVTSEPGDYCWIMMSENDDNSYNDCGQIPAKEGAVISQSNYANLKDSTIESSYTTTTNEKDPKDLIEDWSWKSKSEYGSLICKSNYWFACRSGQEGKNMTIGDFSYTCKSNEWEYQGKAEDLIDKSFKGYHSIELFANADRSSSVGSKEIRQACYGFVGSQCDSEDNDCNGNFENTNYKDMCLITMSEDDNDGNDCGQVLANQTAIISASNYEMLTNSIDMNSYLKTSFWDDAKNLLNWEWKSNKEEYGSLICNSNTWVGCKEVNEAMQLDVGDLRYVCKSSEWKLQGKIVELDNVSEASEVDARATVIDGIKKVE